jgi:hypothetical protein
MTTREKTVTARTRTATAAESQTLADLEQTEQEAMTRVAEARRAAQRLRDEDTERRRVAQEAHDRAVLAGYHDDRQQLESELAEATAALRTAILADPVWAAYRHKVLVQHRLRLRWLEMAGLSARLEGRTIAGTDAPRIDALSFEDIASMVALDAEQQGRAEQEARDDAREQAGQVPA